MAALDSKTGLLLKHKSYVNDYDKQSNYITSLGFRKTNINLTTHYRGIKIFWTHIMW